MRGPRFQSSRMIARRIGRAQRNNATLKLCPFGARSPANPLPPPMLHWSDVRYAFRLLTRSPVFSALTVGVLAGGLGLSIFTFSFLYTAMLKPLPLAGGDAIVRVLPSVNGNTRPIDAVDLAAMRTSI